MIRQLNPEGLEKAGPDKGPTFSFFWKDKGIRLSDTYAEERIGKPPVCETQGHYSVRESGKVPPISLQAGKFPSGTIRIYNNSNFLIFFFERVMKCVFWIRKLSAS